MGVDDRELRRWKVIQRRRLVDCPPWLSVWSEDVELPDGALVEGFYSIEAPDYVAVVAFDEHERIVAIRSYKHGPRSVSIGLPSGYVEPGEAPLAAAKRELLEESGYAAADWTFLGSFVNDGNRGGGTAHLFIARGAQRLAEPDSGDLEEMQVLLLAMDEMLKALLSGGVDVLGAAAAIGLAAARLKS